MSERLGFPIYPDQSIELAEKPNIGERVFDLAKEWLKKKSKRAFIYLGALSFFAGLGYVKRDKIMETAGDLLVNNPLSVELLEKRSAQGLQIPGGPFRGQLENVVSKVDSEIDSDLAPYGTVKIGGAEVELVGEKYLESLNTTDQGEKVEITNPILKNLVSTHYQYVKPPENPRAFTEFIHQKVNDYLTKQAELSPTQQVAYSERIRNQAIAEATKEKNIKIESGHVSAYIDMVQAIVSECLTYDSTAESWLKTRPDGRLTYKWGGTNPIKAIFSSNGLPIDKLMTESKTGVCRHFAETFAMVSDEVKTLFPNRFQNIYVAPITSGYRWHEFNVIFYVTDSSKAEMLVYDPLDPKGHASPVYDLFKTLYHRDILSKEEFMRLMGDYFSEGGTEDGIDVRAFLDIASNDSTETAQLAVRKVLKFHLDRINSWNAQSNEDKKFIEVSKQELLKELSPYLDKYHLSSGENLLSPDYHARAPRG